MVMGRPTIPFKMFPCPSPPPGEKPRPVGTVPPSEFKSLAGVCFFRGLRTTSLEPFFLLVFIPRTGITPGGGPQISRPFCFFWPSWITERPPCRLQLLPPPQSPPPPSRLASNPGGASPSSKPRRFFPPLTESPRTSARLTNGFPAPGSLKKNHLPPTRNRRAPPPAGPPHHGVARWEGGVSRHANPMPCFPPPPPLLPCLQGPRPEGSTPGASTTLQKLFSRTRDQIGRGTNGGFFQLKMKN